MEHLPRPKRLGIAEPETVPCVAVPYDCRPFMTYPLRVGRPHVLPAYIEENNLIPYRRHEKLNPTPAPELESFIQTWLFFGLLHEIFEELCEPGDFIRRLDNVNEGVLGDSNTNKKFAITTAGLPNLLKSWIWKLQTSAIMSNYDHVAQCLQLTFETLSAVSHTINQNLMISIASFAEAIEFASNKAFDVTDNKNNKCPAGWRQILDMRSHEPALKAKGWCPSQIFQLLQKSLFVHSMYFFLCVELQSPAKSHEKCGADLCTAYQSKFDHYETKHVDNNCSCWGLTIDSHLTDIILQDGALPVLRIVDNGNLSDLEVKVLSTQESGRYLAISHVWADGLGNPNKNTLPRCQLRRLKGLCQRLGREAFDDNDDQELLLWIDTMCCAVKPKEAKDRALAKMKRTYEDAACVLVLDSLIQKQDTDDLGVEEICTAIFASGWLRRLWTLQEGALPADKDRLWFHFRDKDINLRTLWQQILDLSKDITLQPLASEMISRIQGFTTLLHRPMPGRDDIANLSLVHKALQYRSVSVPSDEPLLVANLLGLDLEKLLAGPEETRINRLWSLMTTVPNGIPKSILFRVGPKLNDNGYKWAPSELRHDDHFRSMLQGSEERTSQGIPSPRGLLVNLPGSKLYWPHRPPGITDNPWGLIRNDGLLYMRDSRGNWYFVKRRTSLSSPAKGDFLSADSLENIIRSSDELHVVYLEKGLVFPQGQTSSHRPRPGLIVRTSGTQERDIQYVESYMHANITFLESAMQAMLSAAYESVKTLSESEYAQDLATFEGRVDSEDAKYKAVYDLMEPEMWRIAQLPVNIHALSVAKATFGANGTKLLGAFIGLFFIGQYAIIDDMTDDLRQWCID